MKEILVKRIYEEKNDADGWRMLVDRLWPRGISKEKAALDEWAKDFTPSNQLRQSIHHEDISWDDFAVNYEEELVKNEAFPEWKNEIQNKLKKQPVTLVTAAKLEPQNHAAILRNILLK